MATKDQKKINFLDEIIALKNHNHVASYVAKEVGLEKKSLEALIKGIASLETILAEMNKGNLNEENLGILGQKEALDRHKNDLVNILDLEGCENKR